VHELAAPRQAPAHDPRRPVGHPHRVELPRREQPRQRPRIEAIGLRACLAHAGVGRRDDDHSRHVSLEDARDLPRVRGDLERDAIVRRQAFREQLKALGRGLDSAGRAHRAVLADRDLAEIEMHIQPDVSHLHHLP